MVGVQEAPGRPGRGSLRERMRGWKGSEGDVRSDLKGVLMPMTTPTGKGGERRKEEGEGHDFFPSPGSRSKTGISGCSGEGWF